jgi:hypothetical protein
MSKLLTALTKDYLRSLIIGLVAAAIIIPLGCFCLFIPPTIADSAGPDDTVAIWLLPVSIGLFFLVFMGGGLGAFFFLLRRPANWLKLDAAFTPLGLIGRPYLISSRQYEGVFAGRQVNAKMMRGPLLTIHLETPLRTRLNIGEASRTGKAIARTFGHEPMTTTPGLDEPVVYAEDQAWATTFLERPDTQTLLRRLVLGESNFLIHQVHLQKGTFVLHLYRSKGLFNFTIQPEEARQWLDDLLALATIAESLPAPQPPN